MYHTTWTFRCNGFPSRRGISSLDTRLQCSSAHLRSRGSRYARRSATGAECRARWRSETGPRGTADNLKLLFPNVNGCIFLNLEINEMRKCATNAELHTYKTYHSPPHPSYPRSRCCDHISDSFLYICHCSETCPSRMMSCCNPFHPTHRGSRNSRHISWWAECRAPTRTCGPRAGTYGNLRTRTEELNYVWH